jgi:hypothetical protein
VQAVQSDRRRERDGRWRASKRRSSDEWGRVAAAAAAAARVAAAEPVNLVEQKQLCTGWI